MSMNHVRRVVTLVLGLLLLLLLLRNLPTSTPTSRRAAQAALEREQAAEEWLVADAREQAEAVRQADGHEYPSTFSSKTAPPSKPAPKQVPLSNDISTRSLRTRLSYYHPYDRLLKFPNYIWQTWTSSPADADFDPTFRPLESSWTELHPGFVHEVLSDAVALGMVRHLYSGTPEVVDAYESLPRPVLKADFFRYLVLLARGGIYSDIDTSALKPAVDWVPSHVPRESYGLVVGIEADPDREDWADWYSRRIQFCQWTIQAKPGHPVLREIVANITEHALDKKARGTLSNDDVHDVVDFTGPAVWTDLIFEHFNDPRYFLVNEDEHKMIDWRQFTGMTEQRRVGDVIILPITSFSPGVNTMGAGNDDDPMAFVKHHFQGTWKPENERHIGG